MGLVSISTGHWVSITEAQGKTIHKNSYLGHYREISNLIAMFWDFVEEAGIPKENPRLHGEKIETSCRKNPNSPFLNHQLNPIDTFLKKSSE